MQRCIKLYHDSTYSNCIIALFPSPAVLNKKFYVSSISCLFYNNRPTSSNSLLNISNDFIKGCFPICYLLFAIYYLIFTMNYVQEVKATRKIKTKTASQMYSRI